jgi:hypothetical protein
MKHLLILLISILLLSSPVIGDNHKGETLYGWGNTLPYVWKGVGDKDTHPVYKGEVENGEPKGKGIETFPNGEKYVGEFKDGKFHGQGTFTWSNGGKYVGEWKDGKEHGQGTETSPDGNSYEGEWKDGKQNGQGKWTLPNGSQYVGEWKDGIEWRVTIYDKDGKIDGMVWIGVRQF